MNQHTTPCAKCPFRRDIEPGYLGGSPVETYIGQIILPFWLPCHQSKGYTRASHPCDVSDCAGTAIFRTNIGVAPIMPRKILTLPEDTKLVFASLAEFYAHHKGIGIEEARTLLTDRMLTECAEKEWSDANVRLETKQ